MDKLEFNESYYSDNYSTFKEWLMLKLNHESVYHFCRIPYQEWVNEYIETVDNESIEKVKDLLRCLLLPITRGLDIDSYKTYLVLKNSNNDVVREAYKNIGHCEMYKRLEYNQDAWEGLTWVLELLPTNPYRAVQALEGYAYSQPGLPDDRIIGIQQCVDIIMAKLIYNKNSVEKLLSLKPVEFEWLIEELYKKMGYDTKCTLATRDGGKDIIATIKRTDGYEHVYVECKLYKTIELTLNAVKSFLLL